MAGGGRPRRRARRPRFDGADAASAARQDWPPFVLVSGLLLVGLVADEGGLFATAGHALGPGVSNGAVLFAGTVVLVASVTSILNLDTSVAFLTPVLVYAARSRGEGEAPLLYGCLLLSNAASLLLPGSNLTNLIVLGHLHLSGVGSSVWPRRHGWCRSSSPPAWWPSPSAARCARRRRRVAVSPLRPTPTASRLGTGWQRCRRSP